MTARAGKHAKTPQKTLAGLAALGAPAAGTRGFAFGATNAIASGLSCVSLAMAVAKGRLASLLENGRHRNPIQISTTGAGSDGTIRPGERLRCSLLGGALLTGNRIYQSQEGGALRSGRRLLTSFTKASSQRIRTMKTHSYKSKSSMSTASGTRRAMKSPTMLTPGNVRSNTAFTARKCAPVVRTSSTITIS